MGEKCTWKADLNHRIGVWGKVCLFPNHRTIPGSIRRGAESRTSLTQDAASSGLDKTLLHSMVNVPLGCFRLSVCTVGRLC